MTPTSTITFEVPRATKSRWVKAAQLRHVKLHEFVTACVDERAAYILPQKPTRQPKPPRWTRGLSERAAWCLVNYGFGGRLHVRREFCKKPDFNPYRIPNFGRAQYFEVIEWLKGKSQ